MSFLNSERKEERVIKFCEPDERLNLCVFSDTPGSVCLKQWKCCFSYSDSIRFEKYFSNSFDFFFRLDATTRVV